MCIRDSLYGYNTVREDNTFCFNRNTFTEVATCNMKFGLEYWGLQTKRDVYKRQRQDCQNRDRHKVKQKKYIKRKQINYLFVDRRCE